MTTVTTNVDWAVTGSGTNPANAADFSGTLPSGTLSFTTFQTSKTITVQVSGDTVAEPDEGFTVTLSNASGGAHITVPDALGTILNDDASTLMVNEFTAGAAGFTVRFSGPFEPAVLNLYDGAGGGLGPADVTLVGATHGVVRGSLVAGTDGRQITFIRTGGTAAARFVHGQLEERRQRVPGAGRRDIGWQCGWDEGG